MASLVSSETVFTSRRSLLIILTAALTLLILEVKFLSGGFQNVSVVTVLPFAEYILKRNGTAGVDITNVNLSSGVVLGKNVNDAHEGDHTDASCVKRVQIMGTILHLAPSGKHFCPAENCTLIYYHSMDYSKLKTMDAVILYHVGEWKWEQLKRSARPARQIWIYLSLECALKSHNWASPLPQVLNFNWTMTFQRDAHIVFPYGRYISDSPDKSENFDRNWAEEKTKLIVWVASNCKNTNWNRKGFVEKLKEMIPVDMYGGCGNLKCPRDQRCDSIIRSYKFYLAFENSQCKDYITEKLWKNSFLHQTVPIVYGAAKADYERVAPPHSFIHLDDFSNISALVNYIKYLDKNDSAYNEYFAWKRHGSVKFFPIGGHMASYPWLMCDLLDKLRDFDRRNPNSKTWKPEIVDMQHWKEVSCGKQTMPFE